MSIVTKTGDSGTTGLMYNRRVAKTHVRVEAYGCVDELNAAIGAARAAASHPLTKEQLHQLQRDLVIVMGELATDTRDRERYARDGYALVTPELTAKVEELIRGLEADATTPRDWAMPGATVLGATLDVARTGCRRAERRVCALRAEYPETNLEISVYLNRLSDLFWLMARQADAQAQIQGG